MIALCLIEKANKVGISLLLAETIASPIFQEIDKNILPKNTLIKKIRY